MLELVFAVTFAIVAVFILVTLDNLIVTISSAELEDIDIKIPDEDKFGTDLILDGVPKLFHDSIQDPLEILLYDLSGVWIGEDVTEKFLIAPKIILLDVDKQ